MTVFRLWLYVRLRRIRQTINYWILSVQVWYWIRTTRKNFERVATLPRDDAMQIVTRWRWWLTNTKAPVDENLRDVYLAAVDCLEANIIERYSAENALDKEPIHEN